MMDITSLSRERIESELVQSGSNTDKPESRVRLIFAPQKIKGDNFKSACRSYSQITPGDFKTVVVVESTPGEAEKRLAMPSFNTVETDFGPVKANERLRNDFADEDDDFFINDNAFDKGSTLYQQLPILQAVLDDFSIVHIQISDEGPPIIKELAMALQEILPSRNALMVCCCDLGDQGEIDQVTNLLENGNISSLLNRVYRNKLNIEGFGSFLTGLLVAKKWGLRLQFDTDSGSGSVYSGYAVVENQPIFG